MDIKLAFVFLVFIGLTLARPEEIKEAHAPQIEVPKAEVEFAGAEVERDPRGALIITKGTSEGVAVGIVSGTSVLGGAGGVVGRVVGGIIGFIGGVITSIFGPI